LLRAHRRTRDAARHGPARHPDEDETADAYDLVGATLAASGYEWEEISNWARPGHECRHNHVYWDQGDYVGFGSAAIRTAADVVLERAHARALHRPGGQRPEPLAGEEFLDELTRRFERESLALRTRRGVPVEAFDSLEEIAHLVRVREGQVTLKESGRLLANQVIVRLRSGG